MRIFEIKEQRQAAGDRYAAAFIELREAYVELAAHDRALNNGHLGGEDLRTFGGAGLDDAMPVLRHPVYLDQRESYSAKPAIEARFQQIIKSVG